MVMMLEDATYTDYGLLLAILLSTVFIYNKGSLIQTTDSYEKLLFEKPQQEQSTGQHAQRTRNIGELATEFDARFVILWGSQSGTAENLAHRLARDIQQQLKSKAFVGDLSDYDPSTLADVPENVFVVLVMSTFGEGDPSDNAQEFLSYFTSANHNACELSHLRFAAFGCGNSTYRYFNAVIHGAASALQQRGAKMMLSVGSGDEAKRSAQEDFHEWKDLFFSCLVSEYNLSKQDASYEPTVKITLDSSTDVRDGETDEMASKPGLANLPVTKVERIAQYKDTNRTCVFVKLDLSQHLQIKYRTGDHIAVWPRNPVDEVQRLLRLLGKDSEGDSHLRLEPVDKLAGLSVPASTSLWDLFAKHLNICAHVPRETVLTLASMATSPLVKAELSRIGAKKEEYATFLESNHVTVARLMEHALTKDPSASWHDLPLSFIVDNVPPMQPRLYSIASSSIVEPRHASLVVSVKPDAVPGQAETLIHGVSSTYLANRQIGTSDDCVVEAQIRRSTFKLPFNTETPVIMVAAGTGIAPFRGFIQERIRLAAIGRTVGPMLLFFGSQTQSDCLFVDELLEAASTSELDLQIYKAFSRPTTNDLGQSSRKSYVQDEVFSHRQRVIEYLLDEDASFYVCGATSMAKGVRDVLLQTAMAKRQWSSADAEQWRQERRKSHRWHEDAWS